MRTILAALLLAPSLAFAAFTWNMTGQRSSTPAAVNVASTTVATCSSLGGIHSGYVRIKLSGVIGINMATLTVTATDGATTVTMANFDGTGVQALGTTEKTRFFVSDIAITSITVTGTFVGGGLTGTMDVQCVGSTQ